MGSFSTTASTIALVASLSVSAWSAQKAVAAQAQTTPLTLEQRLDLVRTEVFTRPDRANQSVRELHQLLSLDPSLAEAHLLLGLVHVGRRTPEMQAEAVAEFRQALALDPRLTPARFYLARVYMDLGQVERAREELMVILDQTPRQPQFMAVLAETERRLGRPARALEVAGDALTIDPAFTEARYYRGLALLDLGRRDEAIAELERVIASRSDSADAQLSLGAAYLDAGRIDAAIAALTRGIQLAPPKPDAFIYLARAYRLKGIPTRAQELLDRALPPGTVMEASAYYQQIETDLAVEQGLLHLDQKQFAAARRSLEMAAKLNPQHGPAQQHLATAYLRLGLAARAAEAAATAERLGTPVPAATRAAIDAAVARVPAGSTR